MAMRVSSYKKANLLLLIGAAVLLLVSYLVTIKKTVALYNQNQLLANVIHQHTNSPTNASQDVEAKLNQLQAYIQTYSLDSLKDQQYIMGEISTLCKSHNIILKKFPAPIFNVEDGLSVATNCIETEGTFKNQIQLIHALETKQKLGRVSAVRFRRYKDVKTKKDKLSMVVYLQNVSGYDQSEKI